MIAFLSQKKSSVSILANQNKNLKTKFTSLMIIIAVCMIIKHGSIKLKVLIWRVCIDVI